MKFRFSLLFLVAMFVFVTPVFAQGEQPPPSAPFSLDALLKLIVQFATLPGVATLVTSLVNTGKQFGWVADGWAGRWMAGLNLAALGLLVYFKFFQPDIAVEYIDAQAAILAEVLIFITGYLVQLVASKSAHDALSKAGVPVVGFSYSKR